MKRPEEIVIVETFLVKWVEREASRLGVGHSVLIRVRVARLAANTCLYVALFCFKGRSRTAFKARFAGFARSRSRV